MLGVLALQHEDEWPKFKDWKRQSPETERACICQSQLVDAVLGCVACYNAHEDPWTGRDIGLNYPPTMQQYCNADYTVTQTFIEFIVDAANAEGFSEDDYASSSYIGEPPNTSTDVSLYYTVSVTRSDAYDIAVPTPVSGGDVTYITTRISDGQIVPTAQAKKEARGQDPGEAGTPITSISSTRSLGIATPSTSQSPSDDHSDAIRAMEGCYPHNATGHLDFNAPCNQGMAIQAQCAYGLRALEIVTRPFDSGEWPEFSPSWQKVSLEAERTCLCQSQNTDTGIGCLRCRKSHQLWLQNERIEEYERATMQKYCDLDYTITQSFSEFSSDSNRELFFDDDGVVGSYIAKVITSTDVSIYYTLSVTRSNAYDIAMLTPAISGGNVIDRSTRTSDGQIVPTARSVKEPDSPTTDSGAAAVHAQAAGMLAIAALAALGL